MSCLFESELTFMMNFRWYCIHFYIAAWIRISSFSKRSLASCDMLSLPIVRLLALQLRLAWSNNFTSLHRVGSIVRVAIKNTGSTIWCFTKALNKNWRKLLHFVSTCLRAQLAVLVLLFLLLLLLYLSCQLVKARLAFYAHASWIMILMRSMFFLPKFVDILNIEFLGFP